MTLKKKRKIVRKYLDKYALISGTKKYPDKILAQKLYEHKNTTLKTFNNKTGQEYIKKVSLNESSVYAIGSIKMGYVKIGFSHNVHSRLKQIQTGCPFKVKILKRWPGLTRKDEKTLHKCYKKYKAHGEWFSIKGELKRLFS